MEPKLLLVLCLVIGLVVGINGLLLLNLRRGRSLREFQLLRKAGRRARDPWQPENQDLAELSRLVAGLEKSEQEVEEETDRPPPQNPTHL